MPRSRKRSWFGWGFVDEALAPDAVDALGAFAAPRLGGTPTVTPPATVKRELDPAGMPTRACSSAASCPAGS